MFHPLMTCFLFPFFSCLPFLCFITTIVTGDQSPSSPASRWPGANYGNRTLGVCLQGHRSLLYHTYSAGCLTHICLVKAPKLSWSTMCRVLSYCILLKKINVIFTVEKLLRNLSMDDREIWKKFNVDEVKAFHLNWIWKQPYNYQSALTHESVWIST